MSLRFEREIKFMLVEYLIRFSGEFSLNHWICFPMVEEHLCFPFQIKINFIPIYLCGMATTEADYATKLTSLVEDESR